MVPERCLQAAIHNLYFLTSTHHMLITTYFNHIFCSLLLFLVISTPVLAEQGKTVESVAALIAQQHNAQNYHDDMTVSNTAKAVGKNIIFTIILRVQKGLPPAKLAEFRSALFNEVVPSSCKVNSTPQNVGFTNMGLFYTMLYYNTYNEKLAEFLVNKAVCDKL